MAARQRLSNRGGTGRGARATARRAAAGAVAGVVLVGVALFSGVPVPLAAATARPASTASAAGWAASPGASGAGCSRSTGTHMAFVVDFGATVTRVCVAVSGGDDDAQALSTVSSALGWVAPRYASSGLLCAIDGQPTNGCGAATSKGYAYWSYWTGSAPGWTYSNGDPATTPVSAATTVGWRFQPDGRGSPADPPPRAPSDPARACPSGPGSGTITCRIVRALAAPTPVSAPPSPTSTTTVRPPPPVVGPATVPTPGPTTPTTPTTAAAPSRHQGGAGVASTTGRAHRRLIPHRARRHPASVLPTSATPGRTGSPSDAVHRRAVPTARPASVHTAALRASAPPDHPASGGDLAPYAVLGAILAALAAAVVVTRRRRAAP